MAGAVSQQITINNNSGGTLAGPFYLVFDNLTAGVTLMGASGTTANYAPPGSPYLQVTASPLLPGDSASVIVHFSNPARSAITYGSPVPNGISQP